MDFEVKDYCKYINFWLNREVRTNKYEKYQPHFKIFKEFVNNYAYEKQKNYTDTCIEYIHNIDEDVYIKLKFLYEFYELCDDLRSSYSWVKKQACEDLSKQTIYYNYSIVDYYNKDRDLYDKISPVKNLIEKTIKEPATECKQTYSFTIPPAVVKEEREKKARELEEQLRKAREKEEQERLDRLREQTEAEEKMKQIQDAIQLQHETLEQQVSQLGREPETVRESEDIKEPGYSPLLKPRRTLDPSDRLTFLKEEMPERYGFQTEGLDDRQEVNAKTEPKKFLGSLGLPDSITGVLGQVDPVPIVGVSGGMGALFLLFRYTPVGTFFRGRGYRQRIPTRFDGAYPGFLPGFQGFEEGYFPNDQINIAYGRE
ncbi:Plasmodium vivax Vir protein, putative [Plasmodium vivax]|uniref:Vir protein, putative n=1 Tax=Plasmodium vivax TaxID=5855 RepID=A0A1G4EBK1_PLAVI|nr:Plasmodium vivax Vir protein, putative [Plasmodium vivax]